MSDIVGITGSREFRREVERAFVDETVLRYILSHGTRFFAHGCCIGVDEVGAAVAARRANWTFAFVPPDRSRVSREAQRHANVVIEIPQGPYGYRRRNQALVDKIDVLLAFPAYSEDDARSRRSGTWQTIRMARRKGIRVHVYVLSEVPG